LRGLKAALANSLMAPFMAVVSERVMAFIASALAFADGLLARVA
jgi:hypothetical protein